MNGNILFEAMAVTSYPCPNITLIYVSKGGSSNYVQQIYEIGQY